MTQFVWQRACTFTTAILNSDRVFYYDRAAFILGNLTASNNNNRRLLGLRLKGVEVGVSQVPY